MKSRLVQFFPLFVLTAILFGITGCATEPENASVRPWNAPQGWENGLPVGMSGQRR